MILDYPLLENPLTTLLVSYFQRGGYTSGLRSKRVMAYFEKSRNSMRTGGWRRASFHASLWPGSGHADLVTAALIRSLASRPVKSDRSIAGIACCMFTQRRRAA